jgi:L-threonylcarbamoyladenylate synthase
MLTVGISTSSGQFALVIGENRQILFNSTEHLKQEKELDFVLSEGLKHCKRDVKDISDIIVDIGPGGTSRVRTGIAFANSLAYSLGISVSPVSSMELAGIDAGSKYDGLPVISSVKSIKGNAYVGLYNNGVVDMKFGTIAETVPTLTAEIDKFVVVGFHRESIANLPSLKDKMVIDSAMEYGDAKILIEKSDLFTKNKCDFPAFAQPITEKTLIYNNMLDKKDEAVRVLQSGGAILVATDTVYGLAALPTNEKAVEKIYSLKGRPMNMFLPIMVADRHDLEAIGLDINPLAVKLFDSDLVPGAITFVLGFKDASLKPDWLATRDEIATRIPDNELLLAILKETGPLLVTSANRHGMPVTQAKVQDILAELIGTPDLVIEDGEGKEVPSTIINCRTNPPVIERNGVIPVEVINKILSSNE